MPAPTLTDRIRAHALEFLQLHPDGIRYSELRSKIHDADSSFNLNTINGSIWNLDATFPGEVYKPSKGCLLYTSDAADE